MDDLHRMTKFWVGQAYGSPSVQGKAGVITLIHKNFSHTLVSHAHDTEGRESVLTILHEGRTTALCNIYGPNSDNSLFFQNLGVKIQSLVVDSIILGGNLNTVLSPLEDRRSTKRPGTVDSHRASDRVLPPFLTLTGLRDVWRDAHPETRDYMHYSHVHHSWSRLDYLLVSGRLTPRILSVTIGPLVIFDHASVILHMEDLHPRGNDFVWRFPASLTRDESFCKLLQGWWLEYSSTNANHASDPALYWNTAKAILRGRIIPYVSHHIKRTKQSYDMGNATLREAYTSF